MKIKKYIKSLALLILVFLVCVSIASAQKLQTTTKQGVWQDVKLDKWELKFSIPRDLKAIPPEEDEPSQTDEDFTEMIGFKRSIPKASSLEMSVYLRNVRGEKIKTERNGKPVELTADEMLLLDFIGDSAEVKKADSPALEATLYEIDGLKGSLVIMNADFNAGKSIKPTNDIRVIWGTYRLSKGNVQQIMFSIEGKRTQLETMKKIINSLKFN